MMRGGILILYLASSGAFAGMSTGDAFNDGNAFGQDNVGTAKAQISTTTATDANKGVPNYTATDPASGYYLGGTGSLTAPATAGVTDCTSSEGTSDPDAYTHGKCEGVRMLMNDPGKKSVMFPLNSTTDPLVVNRNTVAGDPETYLGSLIVGGAYAGCTDKTIKDADKYLTETCNQYLVAGEERCEEILTVRVTTAYCSIGDVLYSYSTYKGDTVQVLCDANPSQLRVIGNFNGWCYTDYIAYQHQAFISVAPIPAVAQKGTVAYYSPRFSSIPSGQIATMNPHASPNNVLFGSFYRRGCMVELMPSACDMSLETCTINLRLINQYNNDDGYYPDIVENLSSPPIKTPQYHAEEDIWDNQCSALEARLP